MNAREAGFLLLTSQLGDPERKPLTVGQLRNLARRVKAADAPMVERDLETGDLLALGYSSEMAQRILKLLSEEDLLEYYLTKARRAHCVPLTRAGERYPARVRKCLGEDSPGCLWAKGDLHLLDTPCIALVGSRELRDENRRFAWEAGIGVAQQGYTLVSGNARGADKTAQEACLEAGGSVISVVADRLEDHRERERVLYLSEDSFDAAFSSPRALSRNRVIHCLGSITLVAQTALGTGGSWHGTLRNLRNRWSRVCCFEDGSLAVRELADMGAGCIGFAQLQQLDELEQGDPCFLDRA